jgi:hypothetical protein
MITPTKKEQQFIAAYFECVRFTEENSTDFCEVWEREQIIECLAFMVYAECYLSDDAIDQAGHDFWLSRNGHGTGFWDRDSSYYSDHVRDWLQRKAAQFGETDTLFEEIDADHWQRLRADYPAIERATQ